jgi:glyoxylase-like metal-dependent hydrolase (beta-lactamase superfamily II)
VFLTELGTKTLAVTILGTAAFACSSDDEQSGPATSSTTQSTEPPPRLEWHRVDLSFVSAYVLLRGKEAAIVDTGTAGSEPAIARTLTDIGVGWSDVDHVVLTHYHPDHAGSIGAVLQSATGATAYAGAADIALIQSPQPLVAVGDGDDVFGLQVIATPGHTAGHISVLDTETGLFVAGDALTHTGDQVGGSLPQFTADVAQANASVKKIADHRFDTALFGHGDPLEGSADEAVAALAATL